MWTQCLKDRFEYKPNYKITAVKTFNFIDVSNIENIKKYYKTELLKSDKTYFDIFSNYCRFNLISSTIDILPIYFEDEYPILKEYKEKYPNLDDKFVWCIVYEIPQINYTSEQFIKFADYYLSNFKTESIFDDSIFIHLIQYVLLYFISENTTSFSDKDNNRKLLLTGNIPFQHTFLFLDFKNKYLANNISVSEYMEKIKTINSYELMFKYFKLEYN